MTTISLRINPDDEKLIKEYAKSKKISVSALLKNSVLEKIENEIDLDLYKQAMREHNENPNNLGPVPMTDHIHNHIVINSVNFEDSYKFQ